MDGACLPPQCEMTNLLCEIIFFFKREREGERERERERASKYDRQGTHAAKNLGNGLATLGCESQEK